MMTAQEPHFSIHAVAEWWQLSPSTVATLFAKEPGVLRIPMGITGKKTRLRIPESVLRRVHTRMSAATYTIEDYASVPTPQTQLLAPDQRQRLSQVQMPDVGTSGSRRNRGAAQLENHILGAGGTDYRSLGVRTQR